LLSSYISFSTIKWGLFIGSLCCLYRENFLTAKETYGIVAAMNTFSRCNIAFDDTGRGILKEHRQVLAEVNYFLYYDKVLGNDSVMAQEFEGTPDVYGQFETLHGIPTIRQQGRYTLCLQSRLELEIEVDFVFPPGKNTVSCDFTVVGDSVKKFYNLLS